MTTDKSNVDLEYNSRSKWLLSLPLVVILWFLGNYFSVAGGKMLDQRDNSSGLILSALGIVLMIVAGLYGVICMIAFLGQVTRRPVYLFIQDGLVRITKKDPRVDTPVVSLVVGGFPFFGLGSRAKLLVPGSNWRLRGLRYRSADEVHFVSSLALEIEDGSCDHIGWLTLQEAVRFMTQNGSVRYDMRRNACAVEVVHTQTASLMAISASRTSPLARKMAKLALEETRTRVEHVMGAPVPEKEGALKLKHMLQILKERQSEAQHIAGTHTSE